MSVSARADQAVAAEKPDHAVDDRSWAAGGTGGVEHLDLGDPGADLELVAEPAREAEVVRVAVRNDDALDWLLAAVRLEHGFPVRLDVVEVEAGVDDGPAVVLFQQPQVDVVQLEGQRHAHPAHAGSDFQRLSRAGLMLEGVGDRFERLQLISRWKSD